MKQILFMLSVVAALAFLSCDACSAARRTRFLRRQPNPPPARAPREASRVYRYNPYGYDREVEREYYPKYYGGFHARFFDNYGVPTGDVGVRGNGIYWTPW